MPVQSGSAAPPFTLEGERGPISLADLHAEGPALLLFFKVTCGTCKLAFPVYGELYRRYADRLPMLAIGQDPREACRDFLDEYDYPGPFAEDRGPDYDVSFSYDIQAVPTLVLIDKAGTVQRVTEGWDREEVNAWATLLAELAGDGAADPVSTPDDGRPPFKPG